MAGIDIKRFLNSFGQNYNNQTFAAKNANNMPQIQPQPQPAAGAAQNIPKPADIPKPVPVNPNTPAPSMPSNTPQGQAVFAKDMFGFPRNANEFIYMVQRGMTQSQFNQMFSNQMAAQRINLSQMQAQILAQLQGLDTSAAKQMINAQLAGQVQGALKNLDILSGGMINLNQIAQMFQVNGKEAITKLIMQMTEASKAGVTDLSQLKEMAKFINASVAIASENNPQKTLKLLLLLYLPWLPLEEGVDFEVEFQQNNETAEGDSILIITITTLHYGNVKATLVLESSNSVQMVVECSDKFPKKELQERIEGEQKYYSMDSVVSFETNEGIKAQENTKQSASINMSQTNEINPYLLLMAHTVIKQVIDIDNNFRG
jgi:hypothetical protein